MVGTGIILSYSATWKNVVKAEVPKERDMDAFLQALMTLKDQLSCCMCRKLLIGRPLYATKSCDHFVCSGCKGMERDDKALSCKGCEDWTEFAEDESLVTLIAGHTRYCRKFLKSKECMELLVSRYQRDPLWDGVKIIEILEEGAKISGLRVKNKVKPKNISPPSQVKVNRTIVKNSPKQNANAFIKKSIQKLCESNTSVKVTNNIVEKKIPSSSKSSKGPQKKNHFEVILGNKVTESMDIKIEAVYQNDYEDDNMDPEESENDEDNMDTDDDDDDSEDEFMDEHPTLQTDMIEDTEEFRGNVVNPSRISNLTSRNVYPGFSPRQPLKIPRPPAPVLRPPSPPKLTPSPRQVFRPRPPVVLQYPSPRQLNSLTRPIVHRPMPSTSHANQNQIQQKTNQIPSSGQVILPRGQAIRLKLPDGRPVMMVPQQMFNNQINQGGPRGQIRHTITVPINSTDTSKRKVYVRPPTAPSLSPTRLQNISPTRPQNISPTRLQNISPTRLQNMSSTRPQNISPTRLQNMSPPTRPQNMSPTRGSSPTRPGKLSPTQVRRFSPTRVPSPTRPASLSPTRVKNLPQTQIGKLSPTRVPNFSPTRILNQFNQPQQRWPTSEPVRQYASPHQMNKKSHPISVPSTSGGTMNNTKFNMINNAAASPISSPSQSSSSSTATTSWNNNKKQVMLVQNNSSQGPNSTEEQKQQPKTSKPRTQIKAKTGCRCGNAATQPSKLTCCGQRCICYVDGKSCVDCKCKGCNNPFTPTPTGVVKKIIHRTNNNNNVMEPPPQQYNNNNNNSALNSITTTNTVPVNNSLNPVPVNNSLNPVPITVVSGSISSVGDISNMVNMQNNINNNPNPVPSTSTNVMINSGSPSPSMNSMNSMNFVPVLPSPSATSQLSPQIFTRIHHHGGNQQNTTFSQIIPMANFGQFPIAFPFSNIPISFLSATNSGQVPIQSHHPDGTIHLQNIQLNSNLPNLQNQ